MKCVIQINFVFAFGKYINTQFKNPVIFMAVFPLGIQTQVMERSRHGFVSVCVCVYIVHGH